MNELAMSEAGKLIGLAMIVLAGVFIIITIMSGSKKLSYARRRGDDAEPLFGRFGQQVTRTVGKSISESRKARMSAALEAAGMDVAVDVFFTRVLGWFVAAFLVGLIISGPLFGLMCGLFAIVISWMLVRSKTAKRQRKFSDQLEETMQMFAASLRAGYSLTHALSNVAMQSEDPMQAELLRILNEAKVGKQLSDSMSETARRMHSPDFEWVAQAIAINKDVGGNLANVLDQVAMTMRERAALRRQVKTLSAEGKMSAWVLGILPVAAGAFMMVSNPSYLMPLFTTPIGLLLLLVAAVLMTFGVLWLSAATKIKL